MPNPRNPATTRLDMPLDEAVGYATHIRIRCNPPSCSKPCGHQAIWMTADLYAKLPRCRTMREFKEKLKCSRCGHKGWLEIEPAGR
jgi:hypothetical protein